MRRTPRGFSLVELMIVIVMMGILIAIAYPDFIAMGVRARESSTKANMHAFQVTAEDYCVQNHGEYAATADVVAALLPDSGNEFHNPFDHSTGDLNAWMDVATYSPTLDPSSPVRGIVAYADSATLKYVIAANGNAGTLALRLSSGR